MQPNKTTPAKSLSKKIEDMVTISLPRGMNFRQLIGTGVTPEQAATAIEAVTGRRIPAGVLQGGMWEARAEADPLGDLADTLGSLQRSGFPALEARPTTLLSRLIQNKEMREDLAA